MNMSHQSQHDQRNPLFEAVSPRPGFSQHLQEKVIEAYQATFVAQLPAWWGRQRLLFATTLGALTLVIALAGLNDAFLSGRPLSIVSQQQSAKDVTSEAADSKGAQSNLKVTTPIDDLLSADYSTAEALPESSQDFVKFSDELSAELQTVSQELSNDQDISAAIEFDNV